MDPVHKNDVIFWFSVIQLCHVIQLLQGLIQLVWECLGLKIWVDLSDSGHTYVYRSYILVAKSCTNYLVGFTKCNFFFGKKVSNLIFCSKTVKTTFYLCQKNRRPWICWLLRNKWTKYIKTLLKLYLIVHNFIFWP